MFIFFVGCKTIQNLPHLVSLKSANHPERSWLMLGLLLHGRSWALIFPSMFEVPVQNSETKFASFCRYLDPEKYPKQMV